MFGVAFDILCCEVVPARTTSVRRASTPIAYVPEAFAGTECANVYEQFPLPSQLARTNLSSWGVGFRLVGLGGFQGVFNWARPLKSTVTTPAGESRVNFDFSYGL